MIGATWLIGHTTGSSEQRSASACPPVVAYTLEEQRRVADEVDALLVCSVIVGWLADYTVLRGQTLVDHPRPLDLVKRFSDFAKLVPPKRNRLNC